MMIRTFAKCLVFGVFGPPLGLLTFLVVGHGSANNLDPGTFLIAFLFSYLVGLVPALLTAGFASYLDGVFVYLDWNGVERVPKWLLAGAFGYVAAYVNPLMPLVLFQPQPARWGLVGAIPALICAAIADRVLTRRAAFR